MLRRYFVIACIGMLAPLSGAAQAMPNAFSVACDGGHFGFGASEAEAQAALERSAERNALYAEIFAFDLPNRKSKMWWANKTRSAEWTIAHTNREEIVIYSYAEGGVKRKRTFDFSTMLNIATARYTAVNGAYEWTISVQKCARLN